MTAAGDSVTANQPTSGIVASVSDYPKPGYAWLVVAILMAAYLLSFVDRIILTLMVGPIQEDMGLSDTQISLLHGVAFALFYTLLGFPLGRLADRYNRVKIITWGVIIWSFMTALCGVAKNFTHLFLARVGVGIGEAALSPAAYSLITDYFPPDKRSKALSVYVIGPSLGIGVAFVLGGILVTAADTLPDYELPVLGRIYSWQLIFFMIGLPGLLFPLVLKLIKEPVRRGQLRTKEQNSSVPLAELGRFLLLNKRALVSIFFGIGCVVAIHQALLLWIPTFFNRTYGMEAADAGTIFGLLMMVGGIAGVFGAGWLADFWSAKGKENAILTIVFWCITIPIVPSTLAPLMPTATAAFLVLLPAIVLLCAPMGIVVSAIQQIVPNELRGQISALYLFSINLLGLGFGPTLVALLTDYYFQSQADLRYSLALATACCAVTASMAIFVGIRGYRDSLQRAKQWR